MSRTASFLPEHRGRRRPAAFRDRVKRALFLAALVPAPAGAMVIPAGATAEEDARLEALAHAEGTQQKSVVGLATSTGEGSGVFLGLDGDGRTGFVLTAAHCFHDGDAPLGGTGPRQLLLTFGPRLGPGHDPDSLRLPAARAVIHPKYRTYVDHSAVEEGKAEPMTMRRNDLAIVEFDAADAAGKLDKLGVRAAALHEGVLDRETSREGRFYGYGQFGTQRSPKLDQGGRVHCGHTRVSYGTFRGRTGLMHWAPMTEDAVLLGNSTDPLANLYQFTVVPEPLAFINPLDSQTVTVQSHGRQALGAAGDSGAPLFFDSGSGQPELAGVFCTHFREILYSAGTMEIEFFNMQLFEPVTDHLAWIRAVLAGDRGGSLVLEAGGGLREEKKEAPKDR